MLTRVLDLGRLCNRNFCVGGDGVIFALKAPEDGDYDFTMRIYNSDGSGKLNSTVEVVVVSSGFRL